MPLQLQHQVIHSSLALVSAAVCPQQHLSTRLTANLYATPFHGGLSRFCLAAPLIAQANVRASTGSTPVQGYLVSKRLDDLELIGFWTLDVFAGMSAPTHGDFSVRISLSASPPHLEPDSPCGRQNPDHVLGSPRRLLVSAPRLYRACCTASLLLAG